MCYYNRLIVPVNHMFDLAEFTIKLPDEYMQPHPMQSGFEYGDWPIIIWSAIDRRPQWVNAHWEFLSPWAKTMKAVEEARMMYTTLNAVGENLLSSRMYKDAALKRRCLVPSSGFYEWRHFKPAGAKKEIAYPYFVYLPGKPVFYMAGIWQTWTDQETGEMFTSFAIVTTAANALMEQVHNKKKRMPLVLDEATAREWLTPNLPRERVAEIAGSIPDAAMMKAYTIKKEFRTAGDPVEAFSYPDLPPLLN